jgi:hypothetical protein
MSQKQTKPRSRRMTKAPLILLPEPTTVPEPLPATETALAGRTPQPSTLVVAWAECFICGAEGLARPEHNGRCKECWTWYCRTGTDRTPEELGVPGAATGKCTVREYQGTTRYTFRRENSDLES